MILDVEFAIKAIGCYTVYEQAAVANLCREVYGVTDGALLRALRAQGSLEVCSQILSSSLVPSPFPLHLHLTHAASASSTETLQRGSSATSQAGVEVSPLCCCEVEHSGYVLWNLAPTQLSSLLKL